MAPVVDRLTEEYEGVVDFVVYSNVNVSQEISDFSNDHGVQYVPTMMIVGADGTELDRFVGGISESDLRTKLDAAAAQ